MSTRDELTVELELERLHKQAQGLGLTAEDVRKLEGLIKARAFLRGEPTSISKSVKEKEPTDEEVLKALKAPASKKAK